MRFEKNLFVLVCLFSFQAFGQFSDSYETARTSFRNEFPAIQSFNDKAELAAFDVPVPQSGDQGLTTDVIFIPAKKAPERVIIVNSGIHGIEGYVGSAVQISFLRSKVWQKYNDNTAFVIIHAMNPFGFKNHRRVNENNVDLNRNFMVDPKDFDQVNQGYEKEDDLLNPKTQASGSPVDRAWFYMRAVKDIVQYTMKALRQAVLQGQYEFPSGVYFGGKTYEAEKNIFDQILGRFNIMAYPKLFLADLHTGYGKRGVLHLMSDVTEPQQKSDVQAVFPNETIDYGDNKDFYSVHGGLVQYFYNFAQSAQKRVGITLEYGTLNSQTTLGSLDSVFRMSRENQGFNFGYKSTEAKKDVQHLFDEMFYPSNEEWRSNALKLGSDRLQDVLNNFK